MEQKEIEGKIEERYKIWDSASENLRRELQASHTAVSDEYKRGLIARIQDLFTKIQQDLTSI